MSLPHNWSKAKFTDFLDIEGGTQPPKSNFIYESKDGYIRLLQIRDFGKKPVPTFIPHTKNLKKCNREDVLIARYGASIGRIVTGMEGAYNVALTKVIIPEEINRGYVYWYLNSPEFQRVITSFQRTAQSGFNKGDLAEIDFPLAPLSEQKRIVAKLDKLFAHLDQLKARLENVPALLKQFRQAVLTQAVTGKLTEDWRKGDLNSIDVDRELIENSIDWVENNDPIPNCWRWVKLGNYCENHDGARVPVSSKERESRKGDYPYYGATGIIDSIDGFTHEGEFLLIGEDGANLLSKARPLSFLVSGKVWVNNHAHVVKCKAKFLNEYLNIYINSINLSPLVTGSAQPKLTQSNMNSILVPVASSKEQKEIVRRVESLFGMADKIEASYKTLKEKINQLPQAILSKAFRGELVENTVVNKESKMKTSKKITHETTI